MARLPVNPTRMELRKLRARLKTATRGHKLLKDKSDEMVRRFMEYVRLNKSLREEVESELNSALRLFTLSAAVTDSRTLDQTLSMPAVSVKLNSGTQNVMGVEVPFMTIEANETDDLLPYVFASAPSDLDNAIITLRELTEKLLKLAEIEKTCNMLADEIERTRRRVNALEYIMIPQLNETIKYIVMKLDEQERGNLTRLMKVKSMLQQE